MAQRGRKGGIKLGPGQFVTRVGSKYMVVIPKEIRDEMDINEGDTVIITVKKARVEVVPVE